MRYINRRYFENLKEDPNAIWQYLDCIEKIAYHQFQDSSLLMEEVFCDDVNICLWESQGELKLLRNYIKHTNRYFDRIWVSDIENPIGYIKENLDNGFLVGINTYFYDIPNFNWYKNERYRESVHVCMIVGYDESGFLLADVPELMKTEYLQNEQTTIILYDDMRQYLDKQCRILTFREKANTFSICENVDDLLCKIINEYSAEPCLQDGKIVWKGREAYERMLYLIQNNDPRLLEMDFYHGDYLSFIISGRHDILRRNIIKKYGENNETKEVLETLKTCQIKWKILAYRILKDNQRLGIYIPIANDIYDIYESEERLIENLKDFVIKRSEV